MNGKLRNPDVESLRAIGAILHALSKYCGSEDPEPEVMADSLRFLVYATNDVAESIDKELTEYRLERAGMA